MAFTPEDLDRLFQRQKLKGDQLTRADRINESAKMPAATIWTCPNSATTKPPPSARCAKRP